MIPLKRAFEDNKNLVVPVAAGLALNVLLYAGVVYPLSVRVRSTERRAEAATAALSVAQQDDQAVRALLQGRDKTDTALDAFYRDVLPTSASSARSITYLHLGQLAEQHNLRSLHRSAAPEPNQRGGTLERLRIVMSLQGDYENLRRFIHELEAGSDFIVIDGVSIAQGAEIGSNLQLTLNLSTYYKHGT